MSRIILKILSILGLSFLTVVLFVFGQIPLIEGKHLLNKYIDTEFAENYSPEKFEQIKIGMKLDQVIDLIGEPLYTGNGYKDTLNRNYYYTGDGKLLNKTKDNGQKGYDDFAWYRSTIEVNSENIVVNIDKGWSHD